MSAVSQDNATRSGIVARVVIYALLILFAVYYLLPLYVMLVNSLKPLEEIRQGNMLALPKQWTIEPWLSAWSTAQIGVQPTGLKKLVPTTRSRVCMIRAEVSTGRANACNSAVMNIAQTVIGIRNILIPGARSITIVVI